MSRVWKRRDERGAILVMSTVGFVLAIIASALAVDLGRIAQERRRDQKVADLAALDAVRELGNGDAAIQTAAQASAVRNELPDGATVTAFEGTLTDGECIQQGGTGQVCVTISSTIDNSFRPGSRNVLARALAEKQEGAAFTIGSSVASASLDTQLPILNGVFNRLLQTSGTVNLVSWQGVADANVKVRDLQTALGFGTLDELLTSDITAGQLLQATATALNNQGTVAALEAATRIASLAAVAQNTTRFKLGEYINVAQGYENKALDGSVDVLQLITAGAQLANKNNFVDAGSVMTVPNPLGGPVLTMSLGLKVIEGPKIYIGPEGGPVPALRTAQVEVTLTPHIDVNFDAPLINLLGIVLGQSPLRLVGDLPVKFSAGEALGTLTDVRCTGTPGITVSVDRSAVTTSTWANLRVTSQGVVDTLANVRADVRVGSSASPVTATAANPPPDTLVFSYPNEFTQPDPDGKSTGGAAPSLSVSPANVSTTVGVLGLPLNLSIGSVANAVINPILVPLISQVISRATGPALKALGISIGPVDVTAPAEYFDPAACGTPTLVG